MPEPREIRRKGEEKPGDASLPSREPARGKAALVIAPAIVADIVRREALNTAGVVEIVSGSFIGRGKGVSVAEVPHEGDTAYKIEIHLFVEYGTNCRKLSEVLAERITKTVKQMTQRDVLEVTSHVEGVRDAVSAEGDVETDASTLDF